MKRLRQCDIKLNKWNQLNLIGLLREIIRNFLGAYLQRNKTEINC